MTSKVALIRAPNQIENVGKNEITNITDASQINTDKAMSITSRICDCILGRSSKKSSPADRVSNLLEISEGIFAEFFTAISP